MADFITDRSGRHILRLSNLIDAPDYVKEASVIEEDVAQLPNNLFANMGKREFPLDSAGHAWLSYAYCKSAGVEDKTLLNIIRQAGGLYGISADLERLDQAFLGLTKQASHDCQYAISIDFGPEDPNASNPGIRKGGVQGFYPINSDFEVESSAVKMANDKSKIPLELFVEGCRAIVKAASSLGVNPRQLPHQITEYGLERVPDESVIKYAAEQRQKTTGDDIYLDIAETALANPEGLTSYDYAELWLNADRQNNVKQSKHEADPFLLFNSGPTVEAMERQLESWVSIADAPVPLIKVAAVPEADVRKWFSKDHADRVVALVKKAAQVTGSELTAAFSELDRSVQVAFVKHLIAA